MANAIYPKYKENLLQETAGYDLAGSGTTGVYVALVNTSTYTYSATHQHYSDLSGIVGTDQEIGATKTFTNGTFSGANVTFSAVTGSTVGALVLYRKNAGANTTWPLITYLDTSITGIPVTPNGGSISITWSGSGIFSL